MNLGINNNICCNPGAHHLEITSEEKDIVVSIIGWFMSNQCDVTIKHKNMFSGYMRTGISSVEIMPLYKTIKITLLWNAVWFQSPGSRQMNLIEPVQKRAARLIREMEHLSYKRRQEEHKFSLAKWWLREDMIVVYQENCFEGEKASTREE